MVKVKQESYFQNLFPKLKDSWSWFYLSVEDAWSFTVQHYLWKYNFFSLSIDYVNFESLCFQSIDDFLLYTQSSYFNLKKCWIIINYIFV